MAHEGAWFPDPRDQTRLRWWDGGQWTAVVVRDGVTFHDPLAPAVPGRPRRVPLWFWVVAGGLALILSIVLARVAIIVVSVVFVTALLALSKRSPTWLGLRSRAAVVTALVASATLFVVSGSAIAATADRPPTAAVSLAGSSEPPAAEATPSAPPSRSPASSPSSTVITRQEVVKEGVVFTATTVDDPTLPQGQTRIVTAGQNGERTITYAVTLRDGVEASRKVVSDVVTIAPVAQVTAVGSYVEPAPQPEAVADAPDGDTGSGSGCDPNYADGCVPIASDVDCAGGSGNGPAYFDGTARVVGSDIYGLDRDGDGLACE